MSKVPSQDNGKPAATTDTKAGVDQSTDSSAPPSALAGQLPEGVVFIRFVGISPIASMSPIGMVRKNWAYPATVDVAAKLAGTNVHEFEPFRDEDRQAIEDYNRRHPQTDDKG